MEEPGKSREGFSILESNNWYSYVSNNPVKYIDPTGNRQLNVAEIALFRQILGDGTSQAVLSGIDLNNSKAQLSNYQSATSGMTLNLHGYSEAQLAGSSGNSGTSLPDGKIFIPPGSRSSPNKMKSLLLHEIFHQIQYADNGGEQSYNKLIDEKVNGNDPYNYGANYTDNDGNGQISDLSEINTYEGQAQLVEDFANGYLDNQSTGNYNSKTIENAQVLRNSGYESQAINDVLGTP